MSKRKHKHVEPIETVIVEETEQEVTEEIVVEPVKSAKARGIVKGCNMLNIRQTPSMTANVVDIIGEGTEVEVELTESTEDFYKICTAAGSEGYCMTTYIEIVE